MDHITAANAEIRWADNRGPRGGWLVSDVLVYDRSNPDEDKARFSASAGACCSDWLDGSDPRSTPEGVYAGWVQDGFASPAVNLLALRELGKIDTAAWARTMAKALERRLAAEGITAEL